MTPGTVAAILLLTIALPALLALGVFAWRRLVKTEGS